MITKTILIGMLTNHGFPQQDIPTLMCIAEKESNFNTQAINKFNRNGTKDHGLFQINDINKKMCGVTSKQLLNVHANVKCAKKVYQVQNLKAWSTYKLCKEKTPHVRGYDSAKPSDRAIVYSSRFQWSGRISQK